MPPIVESALPNGWSILGEGTYSRPLVASEASMASRNLRFNGHNDTCMGFAFVPNNPSIVLAFINALMRLRMIAPLIAADMEQVTEFQDAMSWIYRTPRSSAEALKWAENTLIVHNDAPEDEHFLVALTKTRLPYEPLPGLRQYFACHLLLRPEGNHSLHTHASHAIFDGRPNLYALRYLFIFAAAFLAEKDLEEPRWGNEIANLPVDLITAIGRGGPVDGRDYGLNISSGLAPETAGVGLLPQRLHVDEEAQLRRGHIIIDAQTSANIFLKLKALRLSLTVLFDAALMIALFERNRPLPKNAHCTLDLTVIALQRFLPQHIRPETYITSCMAFVPLVGIFQHLRPDALPHERLLELTRVVQEQYSAWLSNPNLPLADIVGQPPLTSHRNPYAPFITNFGVIDEYVPASLPMNEPPVLEITDFKCAHRIVHFHRPGIHIWTFQGQIGVQIQATDVFDHDYLQVFAEHLVSVALRILDG